MSTLLSTNLAWLLCVMLLLWLVSLARRDASLVDPFWGTGFVLLAWLSWWRDSASGPRDLLLLAMVTVWGLRLSVYLAWRNWGHEDRRYQAMRERHARRFWIVSLVSVFLLQGVLLWFVAWPVQVAITLSAADHVGLLDAIGFLIWGLGLVLESVADWQMARFKADPNQQGQVFDRGLWRFSRHPNYFGDFCVWWGIFLVAAAAGAWWTILSPLLMSVLLMRVSGVPLLERTIHERRPEYAKYARRTNAFFPGFTKREP